jgi:hypothetical protein
MDIPETLYVIYDVTRLTTLKTYYNKLIDATDQLKTLRSSYPDNKYELVIYRRCVTCDA